MKAHSRCVIDAASKTFLHIHKQKIKVGKYNIIILNPELLMGNHHIEEWWKKPQFTKQILNIIFDEAHCIQQWGSFWNEYWHVGKLCYLISEAISFYITLATLHPAIHHDIIDTLCLLSDKMEMITQSTDCPNLHIMGAATCLFCIEFQGPRILDSRWFSWRRCITTEIPCISWQYKEDWGSLSMAPKSTAINSEREGQIFSLYDNRRISWRNHRWTLGLRYIEYVLHRHIQNGKSLAINIA